MSCFSEQIRALFAECERCREDLHDYQDAAVEFLKKNPFSALFVDLGLGKTISSLTLILDLIAEMESECALVIAPLRVANQTWPTEIGLWRHTACLSWAHIRDEVLVDAINAAGAYAREMVKKYGLEDEFVRNLVHKTRLAEVKRKIKKQGYDLRKSRERIIAAFDKVKDTPVTVQEKKDCVSVARRLAARKAIREHKAANPACIYIINREQVEFLVDAWGDDWPYDTVVIDESSALKDHKTNRFKALAKVRRSGKIKRMHQLTATPAAETYLHLFAQIYLLDLGERLGKSYTEFTERFFKFNKYNFSYKLLPGAEEEIAELISDICMTMKAEDYLDLQKPISVVHKLKLSDEQMALYRQLEKHSVVTLSDDIEIEAETAAELSNKLLQMSSGVLYEKRLEVDPITDEVVKTRVVHHIHDEKIDKLHQLVEEAAGGPILVSYYFKSSLERLTQAFPNAVVMDREGKAVKEWNAGRIPILLVHPQSAGHGLNLQRGGWRIVFFDLPWSLELYLQLIGRLARQGQKEIVIVNHLVVEGTLDEIVLECLLDKRDAQEALFALLKRLREVHQSP